MVRFLEECPVHKWLARSPIDGPLVAALPAASPGVAGYIPVTTRRSKLKCAMHAPAQGLAPWVPAVTSAVRISQQVGHQAASTLIVLSANSVNARSVAFSSASVACSSFKTSFFSSSLA